MRITSLGLSLIAVLIIGGCGGSDDNAAATPAAACKGITTEICSKFYGCFTDEELTAAAAIVGNNEADCRTKFEGDSCSTEMLKCDSGKTYDSAKANECVTQYKSLSCAEFKNPATQTPAACDQVCQ
jgi:hypothetical protein